jgi:hypothetical protein
MVNTGSQTSGGGGSIAVREHDLGGSGAFAGWQGI